MTPESRPWDADHMRLTERTKRQIDSPIGAHAHLLEQVPADRPLIDLSQGAPGFPTAPNIAARIAEVATHPDGGRYAPLLGLPHVREAFADELREAYRAADTDATPDVNTEDICLTSGCNQAFCMVTSALAEPGDDIVLIAPWYFNHHMWLGLDSVGATIVDPADGIEATVDEVAAAIGPRTRAIVVVTPGNPTGHIIDETTLSAYADLARLHGVVLIVDETYRSFVPGGRPHGLFDHEVWRETVVSLHSFSKDFAIPGHRVGAIVASPELLTQAAKLIDCVSICAPRLGQEAVHAGLTEALEWRADKVAAIAAKQGRFESVMAAEPGGFVLHSAGAYYGWVEHRHDVPTVEVVERLILEQGVLAIPGTAFTPQDRSMIRMSFANAELDRLDELVERLGSF